MRSRTSVLITILTFLIIGLMMMSLGCDTKPNIEPGDTVVKCVIDSMSMEGPHSTIEVDNQYYYYTNCGQKVKTNRNDIYHVGDTITYVYKKVK
jgi:hypothetical protein